MKGIYVIRDKDNDPIYVGKSKNIYSRWSTHLEDYPYSKYNYEVLEIVEGDLAPREQHWIDKMNTLLEGNNKRNAVRTVEKRTRVSKWSMPEINKKYLKTRQLALLRTFEGESCWICGETTDRYLRWWPWHSTIQAGFLRWGKKTRERQVAIQKIDESKPVCLNCGADKIWGEEKAPFLI